MRGQRTEDFFSENFFLAHFTRTLSLSLSLSLTLTKAHTQTLVHAHAAILSLFLVLSLSRSFCICGLNYKGRQHGNHHSYLMTIEKLFCCRHQCFISAKKHIRRFFIASFKAQLPEGHSAMDKALAYHAGGQGLNLDKTKIMVLLSSWVPCHVQSLSQCLL